MTQIKILNDQNIGRQIKNRLGLLSSNTNADNFNLEIDSKFEKTTASKDKQGNPNVFNLSIYVKVNLTSDKWYRAKQSFF